MTDETALPEVTTPEVVAGAGEQQTDAAPADENQEGQQTKEDKPERHPLEKELAKERRRINRIVEQREQARAEAAQIRAELERLQKNNLQSTDTGDKTSTEEDPSVVRIPRAELPKLAQKLASEAEQQRELQKAVSGMRKALGDDFQEVTDALADDLGFSADLQFAVAASEAPAELARYLIDPDNAEEAERIARMSPLQAGRALAKIEAKLTAPKQDKPQPSKAATPLQPVRGSAGNTADRPPSDTKAYLKWANERYGRV